MYPWAVACVQVYFFFLGGGWGGKLRKGMGNIDTPQVR